MTAVIHHHGLDRTSGHYTASTFVPSLSVENSGKWFHFDDNLVTEILDPNTIVDETAYVIVYRNLNFQTKK